LISSFRSESKEKGLSRYSRYLKVCVHHLTNATSKRVGVFVQSVTLGPSLRASGLWWLAGSLALNAADYFSTPRLTGQAHDSHRQDKRELEV